VRQSAAAALACLGGKAALHKDALLELLHDSCEHVRYASLVTLGGLAAKARPLTSAIVKHLNDSSFKCRMAALRALKCMGQRARPFIAELNRWQEQWYARAMGPALPNCYKKLERVTTRAIMFADIPLKHVFKGHAPLGQGFAGREELRQVMIKEFAAKVGDHEEMRSRVLNGMYEGRPWAIVTVGDSDLGQGWPDVSFSAKEERARCRDVQAKHRVVSGLRRCSQQQRRAQQRLEKKTKSAWCLLADAAHLSRCHRSRKSVGRLVDISEDWVVPVAC
jgi:hypothetical protein